MRRGRIFYFRKRLPKKLSNQVPNQFLCLSLRADLPLDAVKRAAGDRVALNPPTPIANNLSIGELSALIDDLIELTRFDADAAKI